MKSPLPLTFVITLENRRGRCNPAPGTGSAGFSEGKVRAPPQPAAGPSAAPVPPAGQSAS